MTKPTRKVLVVLLISAVASIGLLLLPTGDARGGMSSSALVGVMLTSVQPNDLIVSFKVIHTPTGDIVWQSAPEDITIAATNGQIQYSTLVNPNFRPDDPSYDWVMWVSARGATAPVMVQGFLFNDIFDVDHFSPNAPTGNIQGRITELHVTIEN